MRTLFLVMTGVAVDGGVVLGLAVAIDAPSHRHRRDDFNDIHAVDLSVAFNAVNAAGNVGLVAEQHMVRQIMNLDPLNRRPISPGLGKLLNFRLSSGHLGVAVHACIDAGNGGHRTFAGRHMAVAAGDFVNASMNLMAKSDGLFRSVAFAWFHTCG